MKFIKLIVAIALLISTQMVSAQEVEKKVIVIKKTKDDSGKEGTERIEATGKDADALIKKMKEDGTLEGIDIEMEIEKALKEGKSQVAKEVHEEISIEKEINDGVETTKYTIKTMEDGKEKILVWEGNEEDMPAEMKEKLEKVKIHKMHDKETGTMIMKVETDDAENTNKKQIRKRIIIKDDQGNDGADLDNTSVKKKVIEGGKATEYTIIADTEDEKELMVWAGKETEISDEIKAKLAELGIDDLSGKSGEMIFISEDGEVLKLNEEEKQNKVTLGVMLSDGQGAYVNGTVDGSAAEKAGILEGDTILKIGDVYTFNSEMVINALSNYDKGDKTKVVVIRDGKEKKLKVQF